jgi:hypothetical protein
VRGSWMVRGSLVVRLGAPLQPSTAHRSPVGRLRCAAGLWHHRPFGAGADHLRTSCGTDAALKARARCAALLRPCRQLRLETSWLGEDRPEPFTEGGDSAWRGSAPGFISPAHDGRMVPPSGERHDAVDTTRPAGRGRRSTAAGGRKRPGRLAQSPHSPGGALRRRRGGGQVFIRRGAPTGPG